MFQGDLGTLCISLVPRLISPRSQSRCEKTPHCPKSIHAASIWKIISSSFRSSLIYLRIFLDVRSTSARADMKSLHWFRILVFISRSHSWTCGRLYTWPPTPKSCSGNQGLETIVSTCLFVHLSAYRSACLPGILSRPGLLPEVPEGVAECTEAEHTPLSALMTIADWQTTPTRALTRARMRKWKTRPYSTISPRSHRNHRNHQNHQNHWSCQSCWSY